MTLFDSSTNIARNISNALAVEYSVRGSELDGCGGGDATDNDWGGLGNLSHFLILLHNPLDAGLVRKSSVMGSVAGLRRAHHWKLCLLVPVLHS